MNNDNNIRDSYEDYDDYYEYEDDFNFMDEDFDNTLLSDMDNNERELVEEAIKISNSENNIQIQDKTFIRGEEINHSLFELHIKNRCIDSTPFWIAYYRLTNKTKTIMMGELLRESIQT